ncbi:A/G-specific adenine glycosylase [Phnomibacter ginsenosidimutans]|uniref:Adenine DNA glycosylase n=1 Tax=Phnomibacter ginsenosidimutans TaxID=2676868 RepID=A0A6I6GJD4_9BACT|nr:A/G-specific adenine glycosylase [Phnomibacter ginsenosidimutans]QGW26992.1 A/G-specific adenine glycosylase [Phnomibacter ginsenosidimutans]
MPVSSSSPSRRQKGPVGQPWFTPTLLHWHAHHNQRSMPWKGEKDPYKIWLSEIILQQTRVEQGLAYYLRFVEAYPTIADLASADDEAVFKLWEGLGYYSRCRNLLAAARQVMQQFEGRFPNNYNDILSLKGVGPYTAAAIASFGFGLPHAVVDGNVIRVLARFYGIDEPFDTTTGKQRFTQEADAHLAQDAPATYNQAIMDFGATVCKPAAPLCGTCPMQSQCVAFKQQRVESLPVKSKKLIKRDRYFYYFLFRVGKQILVRQRQAKDIWQDLYEFPLVEEPQPVERSETEWLQLAQQLAPQVKHIAAMHGPYRQLLTHQTIYASFIECPLPSAKAVPAGQWVNAETLRQLAFPKLLRDYLTSSSAAQTNLF